MPELGLLLRQYSSTMPGFHALSSTRCGSAPAGSLTYSSARIPSQEYFVTTTATSTTAVSNQPTAYACIGPVCSLPLTNPDALLDLLREQRAPRP